MNGPTEPSAALTGVSETALMTLNGRANQAGRPDAIIEDPMAIQLRDALTKTYGVNYDIAPNHVRLLVEFARHISGAKQTRADTFLAQLQVQI